MDDYENGDGWCGEKPEWERSINALETELAAYKKKRLLCEACWTDSWEPIPVDEPGAVKLPDGSYARCGYCHLVEVVNRLYDENKRLKG